MKDTPVSFVRQPPETPEYAGLRRWGLFEGIVFGPVESRRFGRSLGINPLPPGKKICSFDCVYCECGRSEGGPKEWNSEAYPAPETITRDLIAALDRLASDPPDTLTFTGNGEPTLHPEFPRIMTAVLEIRRERIPKARVAVLTNGTQLGRRGVAEALDKADVVMMKLDAGSESVMTALDVPLVSWTPEKAVHAAQRLRRVTIQALFLDGVVSNSGSDEVAEWLERLKEVKPESVVIYTLDRVPPMAGLRPVPRDRLAGIAELVRKAGFLCDTM